MVSLALRVSYHPDETACSVLSRLAAINRITSIGEFCRLMTLDHMKIVGGDPEEVCRLFDLAGFSGDQVAPLNQWSQGYRHLKGGRLPASMQSTSVMRFCPRCLDDDKATGLDEGVYAGYRRISWTLKAFRTCPLHGVKLLTANILPIRTGDFLGTVSTYRHSDQGIAEIDAPDQSRNASFEAYVQRRMNVGAVGGGFPDVLGLPGLITMAEAIGQVVEFGPSVRRGDLDEPALARSANAGFEILREGLGAVERFVSSLEPNIQGPRKVSMYRVWGRFLKTVKDYRDDDIEPIKAVLRRAIVRKYPKKAGSIVFGERVDQRTVHTFDSASKAVGLSPRVLRRLIANVPEIMASGAHPDIAGSITRENLERLIQAAERAMTTQEAMDFLGISRHQLTRYVQYGFIGKMPGVEKFYDRATLESLLNRLSTHAMEVDDPRADSWSMVDAVKDGHVSIKTVVSYVANGNLEKIWDIPTETGLRRFWISKEEAVARLYGRP